MTTTQLTSTVPQTDGATQVVLAVGHVVAACVVIPVIVRSLRTRLA